MSVVNKARDRDRNGRINRKYTRNCHLRSRVRPTWFDRVYHNRPRRRANAALCRAIVAGADPYALAEPVVNHKPQVDWI